MNTFWRISLLILLAISLSFTACDKKDDDDDNNGITDPGDITPANTDWEIIFVHNAGFEKLESYSVIIDWLGDPSALSQTDTYSMKIDGTEYPVSSYWIFDMVIISASVELNPGHLYDFEFYRNGNKVCDANIRMPYNATATFPQNYSPSAAANISWNLSDNNQYQFAGVSAYNEGMDEEQEAIVQIQPSARSYTVPANAVTGFGAGTEYSLLVSEMNFVRDGRTAISAAQGQMQSYGAAKQADTNAIVRMVKRLTRSLSL
jgi:hypothetical protein